MLLDYLGKKNLDCCAVVTKFSPRNPKHETDIRDILEKEGFSTVTMGHTVSGKLNFPRRVATSFLNSAVFKTFEEFSSNIKKNL